MMRLPTALIWRTAVPLALLLLITAACGSSTPTLPTAVPATAVLATPIVSSPDGSYPAPGGYPVAGVPAAGYPVTDALPGFSETAPDPARELPAASAETATIGGALIRELVDPDGFVPLTPEKLILTELVKDATGTPMFIRHNDASPVAEVFDTGVFIFRNIPPGTYGFVVNLGFTEFPVNGPNGDPLLITVAPGEVRDLGQLIVQFP